VRGADDDYRVVIDEDGLDWRGRTDAQLRLAVEKLADLLEPLADGRQVALMSVAYDVECWEQVTLVNIAYTADHRVSRDDRVRLARLLDKCRVVDPTEDDIPEPIRLRGDRLQPSWGLGHVLARAAAGRAMSCLMDPAATIASGWTTIEREADQSTVDLHLLSDPAQLTGFWRGVFEREPVPEGEFFGLASRAFPKLMFAGTLALHHFKGGYAETVPWLVHLLGTLDDHFADAVARHQGDQNKVMAEFKARGVDISPENARTRQNAKAWAQRLVEYEGEAYRCEWHGKRLWDRDRVHFSLPIAKYQNRVLIGIFAKHLD
jgi:hypothetical protein